MNNKKVANLCQLANLKEYTITNGISHGLRVIECDNGKLRFLLNVSKALDIMQIFYEGKNISFVSKNGFTTREIDFSKRFEGGMLYTCGLESLGRRAGHALHGSLHNIPATVTRAECTDEGIIIEASISDSALFGDYLVLKRRIFTSYNSEKVELEDTLINKGTKNTSYCLLYHINLGYPFLDEGGKIEMDIQKISACTDLAKQHIDNWDQISEPKDNSEEMCYFLNTTNGKAVYSNIDQGKRFILEYSNDTLPHFVLWKSMVSGDYALGFEPTTTLLNDKFVYSEIKPGEKKNFHLTFSLEKFKTMK